VARSHRQLGNLCRSGFPDEIVMSSTLPDRPGLAVSGARIGWHVVTEDSRPGLRASDADRDNCLDVLRSNSVEGRLSYETFVHRLDLALHARGIGELAELVSDLPSQTLRRNEWLLGVVRWWSKSSAAIGRAWQTPRLPRLVLPRDDRVFVIGRSPECDLVLTDTTVSWRHAELRQTAGNWVITDLDSTNGTHINGWRAGDGFTVRAGDWVRFGRARFCIAD
jgi:Domain of unknown function (DUF1707)/FHA domain